jgi:hypothetical protein
MRNAWTRGLGKVPKESLRGREVKVVVGSFDDFGASGVDKGSVDAVIIAQAWHWCPDHDKALVRRSLLPMSSRQADDGCITEFNPHLPLSTV